MRHPALVLLLLAVATAAWWRSQDIPGERGIGRIACGVMLALALVVGAYG